MMEVKLAVAMREVAVALAEARAAEAGEGGVLVGAAALAGAEATPAAWVVVRAGGTAVVPQAASASLEAMAATAEAYLAEARVEGARAGAVAMAGQAVVQEARAAVCTTRCSTRAGGRTHSPCFGRPRAQARRRGTDACLVRRTQ